MNLRAFTLSALLLSLFFASCQQCWYEPYRGYKKAPYTLKGERYYPMDVQTALNYREEGIASFYEADGDIGAIGQPLYEGEFYAAHRTLPLPCQVRIKNLNNGRSCEARVADRGPFIHGRLIDVSSAVAEELGFTRKGLERVRVEVLWVGDGKYRVEAP